ncbi:MAG: hypothetical protein HDR26_03595 [Lachnospiraceae bacterium]|nr:hypothetical protein [Lachnospiraceae bacterium]
MSSKTKIVVLHLKELIYTGIFLVLGILFIVLLIIMFLPGKKNGQPGKTASGAGTETNTSDEDNPSTGSGGISSDASSGSVSTSSGENTYIPGVYSTALVLGSHTVDVEVVVDQDNINSVRLVNLDEAVTTMYPLLQPAFDSIVSQIYTNQSLEGITYTEDSKYTTLVLLQAIQSALDKAAKSSSSPDVDS